MDTRHGLAAAAVLGLASASFGAELTVEVAGDSFRSPAPGSLRHILENEAQPDKFPDIPTSLWWGIATLTTVGYGDVFPITPLGRLLGGAIAFLGIGIFAIPTGILANGFAEQIKKKDGDDCIECPHCGKEIEKSTG